MDNNEIMNYEEIEVMDDAYEAEENAGIGTGVAMLIGAGLTFAIGAGVKLGKKAIAAIKAKKEAKKADGEVDAESTDSDEG